MNTPIQIQPAKHAECVCWCAHSIEAYSETISEALVSTDLGCSSNNSNEYLCFEGWRGQCLPSQ